MSKRNAEIIIRKVINQYVARDESYVFLFGSRAAGGAEVSSDYDVGLYRGTKFPLATIARIKDALDACPIAVHVDIVDFARTTEDFKKLALKQIKIWNRPKTDLKLI